MKKKVSSQKITEIEYQNICVTMKCDTETRNTLLTFTFMAVITFLGFAYSTEKPLDPSILLLPYAVLIPFAGRVSYYRKWSAHMATFLDVYAKEMRKYTKFANKVKIENHWYDKILAWLVNYELGFLSITVMIFFYIKYPKEASCYTLKDWFIMMIPAVSTAFVFFLLKSVRNYDKMKNEYREMILTICDRHAKMK